MVQVNVNAIAPETDAALDLLQYAWTILANVSQGNWGMQEPDWQVAVVTWREKYHALLDEYYLKTGEDGTRAPEQP